MHPKTTDQIIDTPENFSGALTNEMTVFKTFLDKADALELAQILETEKIPFSLIDNTYEVDLTFTGDNNQRSFQIYLRQSDFDKATLAQDKHALELLRNIESDHYLFGFTDTELMDLIARRDEWSALDYVLAQKILKERGIVVDSKEVDNLHTKRLEELSKPVKGPVLQIIAGYFFALLTGWIGLIIGWYLWQMKRTLPNGERVYVYNESQRKHGKNIALISFVTTPVYLFRILTSGFFFVP